MASGGGGDDGPASATTAKAVKLPAQEALRPRRGGEGRGLQGQQPRVRGRRGTRRRSSRRRDYKSNPPTSGNHTPDWYQDGIYEPGDTPELGKLVHTLEHGRIDVQYKPGTPARRSPSSRRCVTRARTATTCCCSRTRPTCVRGAATAWTHSLACPTMNPQVFDAIRAFRARYIDKGPESRPLAGPGRLAPAARLAAVEPVAGEDHARVRARIRGPAARSGARCTRGRARSARPTAATCGR